MCLNFLIFIGLMCGARAQGVYEYRLGPAGYVILPDARSLQYKLASTQFYHVSICFSTCSQMQNCAIVQKTLTTCNYYSKSVQLRPGSDGAELWGKVTAGVTTNIEILNTLDNSLTNYWPVISGDNSDKITRLNLTSPNPTYDQGRFGNQAGGLKVSDSSTYWIAPSDVYFSGPYTITGWVYTRNCAGGARFLDFSNGDFQDNVIISLNGQYDCNPFHQLAFQDNSLHTAQSSSSFPQNAWTHMVGFHNGTGIGFYLNGTLQQFTADLRTPRSVLRSQCLFGKNAWSGTGYPQATFDEIRIYNRSLSYTEILNDMSVSTYLIYWTL